MKLQGKLITGYLFLSLIAITIGTFAIIFIHSIELRYQRISEETIPTIESLQDLRSATLRVVASLAESALIEHIVENTDSNASLHTESNLIHVGMKSYHTALEVYRVHAKQFPEKQPFLDDIEKRSAHFISTTREMLEAITRGTSDVEVFELKEQLEHNEKATLDALDAALTHEQVEIIMRRDKLTEEIHDSILGIGLVCLVSFVIATSISIILSRRISGPVRELDHAMDKVGRGDLSTTTSITSNDEFGNLSRSFNKMTDDLRRYDNELQQEIASRKHAEEELKRIAYYDHLTQLPNRTSFLENLGRILKRSQFDSDYIFAVLLIDLDRFQVINDSMGHTVGDKLLLDVSQRLEKCIRPTDRIARVEDDENIARFGGDEFAIILDNLKNESSATRVANRILEALQSPFDLNGNKITVTASIGIALSSTGYENEEDILRDADSAMYRAKAKGRACSAIFDEAMHVRVKKTLMMESELRTAVNREDFAVYYQPIVSATNYRIIGAEALIRWIHPQDGFISPMDFIPIAEETGLIIPIGEWILRTACLQSRAWQDAGFGNLLMRVNFSSRQFKDKTLKATVKGIVEKSGIPFHNLGVEITESIAMAEKSIDILNELTALGVRTSIDDFGTGYSSLGSLTRFPIDTIKIDRVFIKDMTGDRNAQAVVRAMIAMAHSLSMEVVAEGVETEEQLELLQTFDCDKIQGYLFSPPVPAEAFREFLENERKGVPLLQNPSRALT